MKSNTTLVPQLLGAVFVAFIGILIYVYVEARAANPVILDEHGQVRGGPAK